MKPQAINGIVALHFSVLCMSNVSMKNSRRHLELLSPAKNADFGIEAINHGADAVYIGGPAYGARAKAPNTVEEQPDNRKQEGKP